MKTAQMRTARQRDVSERGWKRRTDMAAMKWRQDLCEAGAESPNIWQQGDLGVCVSREPLGPNGAMRWHLSISHPDRYPTWDEIAAARYGLVPDVALMVMILPSREQYVNVHPNCFHLHEVPEAAEAAIGRFVA